MTAYPSTDAIISADQLRRRYIVALTLITLLTILSQAVVQYLISDQEYDSRVVNIAGRQRMLSQRITKTVLGGHRSMPSASYWAMGRSAAQVILFERGAHIDCDCYNRPYNS